MPTDRDLLAALAEARDAQASHERAAAEERARARELVRELKKRHTLDEVAELTGLTKATVEYALHESAPSRQRRREGPRVPAATKPGISVAEAARRLGVSRPTVYAWVDAGKVAGVEHAGHTRIDVDAGGRVLSPEGQPL